MTSSNKYLTYNLISIQCKHSKDQKNSSNHLKPRNYWRFKIKRLLKLIIWREKQKFLRKILKFCSRALSRRNLIRILRTIELKLMIKISRWKMSLMILKNESTYNFLEKSKSFYLLKKKLKPSNKKCARNTIRR